MVKRFARSAWALLVALVVVGLSSCSQDVEYARSIPADASVVVSVDLESLAKKGDFSSPENKKVFDQIFDELRRGGEEDMNSTFDALFEDPKATGLKFSEPIYFYGAKGYVGFVAKVRDEKKLAEVIEGIIKVEGLRARIEEGKGFRYVFDPENPMAIAFDSERFVVLTDMERDPSVTAPSALERLEAMMAQDRKASMIGTPQFTQMLERKGDIRAVVNYGDLLGLMRDELSAGAPAVDKMIGQYDWRKVFYIARLSFESGKIALQMDTYTENAEIQALYERNLKVLHTVQGTFAKYFPASSFLYGSVGVNGSALLDALASTPVYAELTDSIDRMGIPLREAIGAIDGDVALGVSGIDLTGVDLSAYASVKDSEAVRKLLLALVAKPDTTAVVEEEAPLEEDDYMHSHMATPEGLRQTESGEFVYRGLGMDLYMGIKDDVFYLTSVEGRQLVPQSKDVTTTAYADAVKGAKAFYVLNVQAFAPMLALMGPAGAQVGKISYVSVTSENLGGLIEVQFTDKKTNALKQLVEIFKAVQ